MEEQEFIEEEFDETEEEEFSVKKWREEEAAERAEVEKEALADEERFAKATDDGGNFLSVKHEREYFQISPDEKLPGDVDEKDYKDKDQYLEDLFSVRETGKLVSGLDPAIDDPHAPTRRQLMKDWNEWEEKEILAKESGNADALDRAKFFKKDIAKQIRALPEPPIMKRAREVENERREFALATTHNEDYLEDPFWDQKRSREDSPTLSAQQIVEGEGNIFWIPKETSPRSGNFMEWTPQNVLRFEPPENIARQMRQAVKDKGAKGRNEIWRAAMGVLYNTGYAGTGKGIPVAKKKPKKVTAPKNTRDPKNMTMKEFEQYRMKQGAKPY